jgi:outer membrane lipoprotein-sorting protein
MNKPDYFFARLILLFLVFIVLSSCTGSRKAVREPIKEQGAEYLVTKLKEHELKFQQFSAKFNAVYTTDKKKTTVSGNLRIESDSIIWISISPALGIEAVRFMLTPDSIKFINRLSNTYLEQNFSYINQLLNKTLDYDMAQSFLTGNDFSLYDSNTFRASVENQEYKLNTTNRRKLRRYVRRSDDDINIPIQSIWLNPENFKISRVLLKEADRDSRKFEATYSEFEKFDENLIPTTLDFKIETVNNKVRIKINYSNVQIDKEQTYPFRIPEKYTEIIDLQPDKK